jgi:hypothetical protein
MPILLAMLTLILPIVLPTSQSDANSGDHRTVPTDFCDLFRHSDKYVGTTVQVTAVYGVGIHEATFFDDTCVDATSGRRYEAKAKFADNSDGKTALNKVATFMKHSKLKEVQVIVVANFRDVSSPGMLPREYELEVIRVLSVQEVASHARPG